MKIIACLALFLFQSPTRSIVRPCSSPGGISVNDFGASADGMRDNYDAITAAIANACAAVASSTSGVQGSSIYFPGGALPYRYSKVPVVNCSNITLHGDRLASHLLPSYTYGPPIVIHPPIGRGYIAFPTQSSLVSGQGQAMTLSASNHYWINLRDAIDISDLSSLTVEFFTQLNSVGSDGTWIASYGRRTENEPATSALRIGISAGGQLTAQLTTGGTQHSLTAATPLSAGSLYHIALTYDGNQIVLFLNGTPVGSQAASGTVTQPLTENFTLGPILRDWPEADILGSSVDGAIDSVRISSSARYSSSFATPNQKFSLDGQTLLLLNFDNQYDAFTVGSVKGADHNGHLFLRYSPNDGAITDVEMSSLYFDNGNTRCGPMIRKANASRYNNLEVRGGSCGLWLQDKDYETEIDYYVYRASTVATRFDLAATNSSGVLDIVRPLFFGGRYQFVDTGDQSSAVRSAWFQTESNTVVALLLAGAGGQSVKAVRDSSFNTESGGDSLDTLIVISNIQGSVNLEADILQATPTVPSVKIEGGGHVNIMGGLFFGSDNASANITIPVAPSSPVYLYGVSRTATTIPWADNPALLVTIPNSQ